MRASRFLLPAIMAVALVPFAAAPASAAPPGNDEATGAVAVHLGVPIEQDTSEATTNAGDAALNANCGAPATNASVWYTYSSTVARKVVLDTSDSSYSTGLMVFRGTPTADSMIACGPVAVGLRAKPGRTYTIMAFSDTEVNGGTLVLTAIKAPTPRVHVHVARHGAAFHGGAARLHGSYRCTHAESFAGLSARLLQRAGRLKIQAESDVSVRCDGRRHHWSARLVSQVGTYAQGRAVAKVAIFACGLLECRQDKARRHVRLGWTTARTREWMAHPTTGRTVRPHPLSQRHWPSS
jgi:hypothetical protein